MLFLVMTTCIFWYYFSELIGQTVCRPVRSSVVFVMFMQNILGDNFYDQKGDNTGDWFNALSKSTKTKVLGSIPGNHGE